MSLLDKALEMSISGWIFMLGSWILISCLSAWCIRRLLKGRQSKSS